MSNLKKQDSFIRSWHGNISSFIFIEGCSVTAKDRNASPAQSHGDIKATQRFQEVGAAWEILREHYEDPQSSAAEHSHDFHGQLPNTSVSMDVRNSKADESLSFYL
jgi:hypothetical protein